jgi:hypothetical protein
MPVPTIVQITENQLAQNDAPFRPALSGLLVGELAAAAIAPAVVVGSQSSPISIGRRAAAPRLPRCSTAAWLRYPIAGVLSRSEAASSATRYLVRPLVLPHFGLR